MKILVYDDLGSSSTSVKHIVAMLESTLSNKYSITLVDRKVFASDDWQTDCAMLVMPGGRDLPYCQALNGRPNQAIKAFVERGGRYLGICAGAYYASQSIEFEKGNSQMEIVAARQLGFYPGICRGTAYPGFSYSSERGARLVPVSVHKEALGNHYSDSDDVWMYYNGGGYFVDPDRYSDQVTVLCDYKELDSSAAIVHCRVGKGHALLISTHPEYEAVSDDLLLAAATSSHNLELLNQLVSSRKDRNGLMRSCLSRIQLDLGPINSDLESEFKPVEMYITGLTKASVSEAISPIQKRRDPITYLMQDALDSFCLTEMDTPTSKQVELLGICRAREGKSPIIQLNYPTLLNAIEPLYPLHSTIQHFDIAAYYQLLVRKRQEQQYTFGSGLLYTLAMDRIPSVLTRNPKFLQNLPSGFVCIALDNKKNQDQLCFSIILHHSLELRKAPIVFIQYLASLAIVESFQFIDKSSSLRIKWPNYIFLETKDRLVKIGQSKVHSSFANNQFNLIVDNQIDLSNIKTTMSDNNPSCSVLTLENALTDILLKFESFYIDFTQRGIDSLALQKYHRHWLHSNAIMTLSTTYQQDTVKIVGVTSDHGMLKVESLQHKGKLYGLLPDNHFLDLDQNLITTS